MKNSLFSFRHDNTLEKNDHIAAQVELPLTFRIHDGQEHNTRTIKTSYILSNGSHHGFDLSALLAYRLDQEISGNKNSSSVLTDLKDKESNLVILAKNPNNIAAILSCLPASSDAAKFIKLAFPEGANGNKEKSDFFFFSKNCKIGEYKFKRSPSESMILIMKIYESLQRCNRIEVSSKLQEKLDMVTLRAFTMEIQ
jgi:hypothetical protein